MIRNLPVFWSCLARASLRSCIFPKRVLCLFSISQRNSVMRSSSPLSSGSSGPLSFVLALGGLSSRVSPSSVSPPAVPLGSAQTSNALLSQGAWHGGKAASSEFASRGPAAAESLGVSWLPDKSFGTICRSLFIRSFRLGPPAGSLMACVFLQAQPRNLVA